MAHGFSGVDWSDGCVGLFFSLFRSFAGRCSRPNTDHADPPPSSSPLSPSLAQLNGARDSGVLVLQSLDLKGVPEALTAASGGLQELCELGKGSDGRKRY